MEPESRQFGRHRSEAIFFFRNLSERSLLGPKETRPAETQTTIHLETCNVARFSARWGLLCSCNTAFLETPLPGPQVRGLFGGGVHG